MPSTHDCCYKPNCAANNAPGNCCDIGQPGDGLCGEGEGDCDNDDGCAPGLKCGNDNCPAGMPSTHDCCYKPSNVNQDMSVDAANNNQEAVDNLRKALDKIVGKGRRKRAVGKQPTLPTCKKFSEDTIEFLDHVISDPGKDVSKVGNDLAKIHMTCSEEEKSSLKKL